MNDINRRHQRFFRKYIKDKITDRQYHKLRNAYSALVSIGRGRDLNKLGRAYMTDKVLEHNYGGPYMAHFAPFRRRKVRLLEIGVGGYDNPAMGGESLRMWKRYFRRGRITGIDIYEKSLLEQRRIKIFKGSQVDESFLDDVDRLVGPFDLIIDDGSHLNEHVVETFHIMFPKLKDGGVYVVEDMQTSYWESYGGDSDDLNNPATMMNFFKGLADCLNHSEFVIPGYERTYYDRKIVSMHFYHNMVFIHKGDNDEGSNRVADNAHFKD